MLASAENVMVVMENTEKPAQNDVKKRSQSEKKGRERYNQELLKRTLKEVHELRVMMRTIMQGLKGYFHFEKANIIDAICNDEVDRAILTIIFEQGNPGALPKDVVLKLSQFKLDRFQVTRRLIQMNKRLVNKYGENVAEKRGHKWALTDFAFRVWNDTEEEQQP